MSRYHHPSTWLDRVAVFGCLIGAFILMQLTAWKENEYFWTLSGGYDIWLRDLVHFLYYPFLLGQIIALVITSKSLIGKLYKRRSINRCLMILFFAWVVFFSSLALLVANNLLNFLEGRPIHYHDPIMQPYQGPGS